MNAEWFEALPEQCPPYLVDTIFFKYFAHSFNQNVQYNADDSF